MMILLRLSCSRYAENYLYFPLKYFIHLHNVHLYYRLAELVTPPRIVRELSWVNNCWPDEFPGDQVQFERPLVQRYCLMGVKDSYTDFHVDFGGTSVWYHVLRVRNDYASFVNFAVLQ